MTDAPAPAWTDPAQPRCRACAFAAFAWPLLFLFRHLFGGSRFFFTIGNDFMQLYYNYKAYLLDVLSHGRVPLWSPAEAAGYPFYSSPFAQAFYPLNVPLALFCKAAGGYSPLDHQRFAVLGLSIFSLGMYRWLRALGTPARAALAAAIVVATSFKMTEILRFPNAVHAAAWMPWVLYGLTRLFGSPGVRRGAVTAGAAFFMMLTAGYPYYVVYSALLFGPYLLLLASPALREGLFRVPARPAGRLSGRLSAAALAFGLPTAACLPYLLKMRQLMAQTTDRSAPDFRYATSHVFDWWDTLGSFLFPPASQIEGWFYFGAAGFLLLGLYVAGGIRDGTDRRRARLFRAAVVIWCLVIELVAWGRESPLFRFLWDHVPVFSQMRVWGRVNIVLVPVLGLLLAKAIDAFERTAAGSREDSGGRAGAIRAAVTLGFLAAGTVAAQFFFLSHRLYDQYWILYGKAYRGLEPWFTMMTAISAIVLAALLYRRRAKGAAAPAIAIAVVLLTAVDLYPVSSRQWSDRFARGTDVRSPVDVGSWLADGFRRPRVMGYLGLEPSLAPRQSAGMLENWYYQRYGAFVSRWWDIRGTRRPGVDDGEFRAASRLLGLEDGRRIFLSRAIDHGSPGAFLADASASEGAALAGPSVLRYDGDELEIAITLSEERFLSFIDNWDPDWTASLDGVPVPIGKPFGTFKSVRVPPGSHRVVLSYRPIRFPLR